MRTMCAVTRYVSSSVRHPDGHTPQTPVSKLTDEQLVEHCLAEAGTIPGRRSGWRANKHASMAVPWEWIVTRLAQLSGVNMGGPRRIRPLCRAILSSGLLEPTAPGSKSGPRRAPCAACARSLCGRLLPVRPGQPEGGRLSHHQTEANEGYASSTQRDRQTVLTAVRPKIQNQAQAEHGASFFRYGDSMRFAGTPGCTSTKTKKRA